MNSDTLWKLKEGAFYRYAYTGDKQALNLWRRWSDLYRKQRIKEARNNG